MGHRVVVRHRIGPLATDVVGLLVALDERRLTVRTEDGADHAVALADVVAGKRVGPRPAKYSEMITLEKVADRAWPAPEHERLGDWYLRAAGGWTNRANSALPVGDAGVPLDVAARTVATWYADRGLRPRITVPLPVRRDVAGVLVEHGWVAQPRVLVQTATLPAEPAPTGVTLTREPSADLLAIVTARKEHLPAAAMHVLTEVPAVRFAEARDPDGALLAITRGAALEGWLHIGVVEVVPAARRRGLAGACYAALADWARTDYAATRAVLQVEEHNEPAVALYARLGFTTHHTYITYHLPA